MDYASCLWVANNLASLIVALVGGAFEFGQVAHARCAMMK